jgi:hypothetical protein
MARTRWYFAYGPDMSPRYLKTWLTQRGARPDGVKSALRAILAGYRLAFNAPAPQATTQANLVEDPNGKVEGVLYELDEATLSRISQRDAGRESERITVRVEAGERTHEDVVTFLVPAGRCADGRPAKRHVEWMLRAAEEFGFSAEYVARLRAVPVAD